MTFEEIKAQAAIVSRDVGHYGSENYINRCRNEHALRGWILWAASAMGKVEEQRLLNLDNDLYLLLQHAIGNTGQDGDGI